MRNPYQDVIDNYQKQIDSARDRIRMFKAGEMAVHDAEPPHRDWTPEAIANDEQLITKLEKGIDIVSRARSVPEAT